MDSWILRKKIEWFTWHPDLLCILYRISSSGNNENENFQIYSTDMSLLTFNESVSWRSQFRRKWTYWLETYRAQRSWPSNHQVDTCANDRDESLQLARTCSLAFCWTFPLTIVIFLENSHNSNKNHLMAYEKNQHWRARKTITNSKKKNMFVKKSSTTFFIDFFKIIEKKKKV